uniref:Dehydrogenase/reductase (SDR family) member 13a, tandem duplicate 1 n=1 Tax=Electrophorus electricus TaxID=8005 RepID=A0A4W4F321_ELEEL
MQTHENQLTQERVESVQYRTFSLLHVSDLRRRKCGYSTMMFDFLIISAALLGIGYAVLWLTVLKMPRFKRSVKLNGKTVIITGSNTGIGRATALDLAKRGARIILACRDKQRAEMGAGAGIVYMHLDLASLQSVRSFAENFLKTEPRLDILINNAGEISFFSDGLGMIFGVNHIGHFLLTVLLLDRLKACAPSRVVTVSSRGYEIGNIDFECINAHKDLGRGNSALSLLRLYTHSKLCNILFTHELAKRLEGTNVTCYSLHPGAIRTEIGRHANLLWKMVLTPIMALFFRDVESGVQTTLYCALQEGIEHLSGRYFSKCAVQKVRAKARDDATAKKLWEVSERLSGLA